MEIIANRDPGRIFVALREPALKYTTEAVALCMLDPVMTVAQVSRLRSAIGETQWADIVAALEAASGESIDVPLSRAGSAARTTSGS